MLTARKAETIDVVVLAGGENSRLEALSGTIFKPFLPLRRASLVARHLTRCALAGVDNVVVVSDCQDSLASQVVDAAKAAVDTRMLVLAAHHSGTPAEKILLGAELVRSKGPLVVVLGDSFARYDPCELVRAATRDGADSAMAVADYRLPFGTVEETGGIATGFTEKPHTGYLVNTGHLALGPTALALLRQRYGLGEALAVLARERRLATVRVASDFVTIDSLEGIAAALRSGVLDLEEVNA
jgi:NDP-sugar pyrophosphorylase family protein